MANRRNSKEITNEALSTLECIEGEIEIVRKLIKLLSSIKAKEAKDGKEL